MHQMQFPRVVVAHRRARVGARGGLLDIPERHPGVEGGGDERMPQRVRPNRLGDSGAAGQAAHDPGGTVPVQPLSVGAEEDRPVPRLTDGQADRPGSVLSRTSRLNCQPSGSPTLVGYRAGPLAGVADQGNCGFIGTRQRTRDLSPRAARELALLAHWIEIR